jgi:hypothetical protein
VTNFSLNGNSFDAGTRVGMGSRFWLPGSRGDHEYPARGRAVAVHNQPIGLAGGLCHQEGQSSQDLKVVLDVFSSHTSSYTRRYAISISCRSLQAQTEDLIEITDEFIDAA